MSITTTLNYWMSPRQRGEFLGFVNLVKEAHFGLVVGDSVIAPMFLFQDNTGWGDGEPTSNKFSWVLHIEGTDDHSIYMLFGAKEGAINYASEYLYNDGRIVDPWEDTYKGRKWNWQN